MWTAVLEHLDGNDSWYMVIQRARKTHMDAALFQFCAVDEADSASNETLQLAPWDQQAAALREGIRSRNRSTSRGSERPTGLEIRWRSAAAPAAGRWPLRSRWQLLRLWPSGPPRGPRRRGRPLRDTRRLD